MIKDILTIGYGTVGKNVYKAISSLHPYVYDKYNYVEVDGKWTSKSHHYDIAFICVDTPLCENKLDLDISEVENAIYENNADIYVIKSTCPIGTVNKLIETTGKHIIFSPEYYGNTPHCNNFEYNFTILGGDKSDCIAVQQVLQHCYDGRHVFRITDSQTAELLKFMENCWVATKVSFCTQFYEIANNHNIAYEDLRELFLLDPRVSPSHTFVYRDEPYWSSHCLDKDVYHIANAEENADLLKSMISFNESQKKHI